MNLYLEKIGTQGVQSKTAFYTTPGQKAFATVTSDVGTRGALSITSRAFAVVGGGIHEFQADGTTTRRASVVQDSNLAQAVWNGPTGNQVLYSSGNNAELYDLTANTLTRVLSNEATQIGMLDEYFLALNANTGKLRLSNLNDGLTWDPLQFALRSAQPDPWKAMIINAPDVWLLGDLTGEIWYDAGTSPFPLAARTGLSIPYGIGANFSLAQTGGTIFWLSMNKDGAGTVVRATGYNVEKISTSELDTAISGYQRSSIITDAEALVYQQEGHTFYVLRFPSANATWAYDLTTGVWAERGSWNAPQMRYDVWHPRVHVYAFGQHFVGEAATNAITSLDVTVATEATGDPIRRLRRGPVLVNENRRLEINRFELAMETGIGTQTGQGSDPQVMARFSGDGGKTWGNERTAGFGKVGKYGTRVFWSRLGSPRLFVPEVVISDPVPTRIVDCFINNDDDAVAA